MVFYTFAKANVTSLTLTYCVKVRVVVFIFPRETHTTLVIAAAADTFVCEVYLMTPAFILGIHVRDIDV